MERRRFLKTIGAGAAVAAAGQRILCAAESRSGRKPNIVYINIDDLGWKDVGFMGSRYYETPNIDRLAREGMVFTNAYAPAANCAPSRACCMSGQYAPRHGIYTVGNSDRGDARTRKLVPTPNQTVLADDNVTIAEALKTGGYATCHVGKWHLGPDPKTQGFDVNIGGNTAGHPRSYFSPYRNPNLEDGPKGEYLTDRLTTEAICFVEDHRDRPFFLYLSCYAVHTPIQPKKEKVGKYENKQPSNGQQNARYAAMIESVDENIGRLMQTLDRLGLTNHTLVLFMSDNGGVYKITKQWPLRAGKGSYYEGGIREPMFVRWPGKVKAGTTCDAPVSGIDFYPTFLDVAGLSKPQGKVLDGLSLMPLLTQTGAWPTRPLYWHFPIYLQGGNEETRDRVHRTRPGSVVRCGDWKLHEYFEDSGLELYHLGNDVGEKRNLAESQPDKAKELHAMLAQWRRELHAPVPSKPNPKYDEAHDMKLRGQQPKSRRAKRPAN